MRERTLVEQIRRVPPSVLPPFFSANLAFDRFLALVANMGSMWKWEPTSRLGHIDLVRQSDSACTVGFLIGQHAFGRYFGWL